MKRFWALILTLALVMTVWSPTGLPARRVLPNAATLACESFSFLMSWKKAMSFGFDAAKPPSM